MHLLYCISYFWSPLLKLTIMDVSESQGYYNQVDHVQNGETEDEKLLEKNGSFNHQVEYKNPVSTGNLNSCCHGDSCAPTVSIPDNTLTRQLDESVRNGNVGSAIMSQSTPKNMWSLVTLPPELILVIFSYLDARFTLRVMTCVCRLFYNLLLPESSWKTRFGKRWPRRDNREDYDYISRFVQLSCIFIDMFYFVFYFSPIIILP